MPARVEELSNFYGERIDSLIESMFPDGYLNFGYWRNIKLAPHADTAQRIESGKELYRQALRELCLTGEDRLLEVGCGRGRGSALAMIEYLPSEVHGVDAVERQVEKSRVDNANAIEKSNGRLSYRQGAADALPYPDDYFDKVCSVEAMTHFPDVEKSVAEIARVSAPNARIAIASIFAPTRKIGQDRWTEVLTAAEAPPTVVYAHPIADVVDACYQARFTEISVRSIGAYVWPGFNKYLDRLGVPSRSNRRKWLTGYERGVLDYYVIMAASGSP